MLSKVSYFFLYRNRANQERGEVFSKVLWQHCKNFVMRNQSIHCQQYKHYGASITTCVQLQATLSFKIYYSEKYEGSWNSPTIIECLWRGNDAHSARIKVGSWFFEWTWRSIWSHASWATEYSPNKQRDMFLNTHHNTLTSPCLIFIFSYA